MGKVAVGSTVGGMLAVACVLLVVIVLVRAVVLVRSGCFVLMPVLMMTTFVGLALMIR